MCCLYMYLYSLLEIKSASCLLDKVLTDQAWWIFCDSSFWWIQPPAAAENAAEGYLACYIHNHWCEHKTCWYRYERHFCQEFQQLLNDLGVVKWITYYFCKERRIWRIWRYIKKFTLLLVSHCATKELMPSKILCFESSMQVKLQLQTMQWSLTCMLHSQPLVSTKRCCSLM